MKYLITFFIFVFCAKFLFAQDLEVPKIDSITVLNDLKVKLFWSYTKKSEINGYRIKRRVYGVSGVIDGSFVNIATINDPNTTWFLDTSTNYTATSSHLRQESYVVEAYHFDGVNYDYSNLSEEHKTLWIKDITYEHCSNENILNWEHYVGWGDSIAQYEIFLYNEYVSDYQLLATLSGSSKNFIHSALQTNRFYNYKLRAKHKNGISSVTSNYSIGYTQQPMPPQVMNADQSEILESKKVKLTFSITENSEIERFYLLRTQTFLSNFDTIAKFQLNSYPFEYQDSIDIQKQYFYKILALNDCNWIVKETNITSNIVLNQELSDTEFGKVILNWTRYKEYKGGFRNYKIFRQIATNTPEELFTTTDTFAIDKAGDLLNDLIATGNLSGNICYYVEAQEDINNPHGVQGVSKSNLSCIALEPKVYVPNAFNPLSYIEVNSVFKPIVSYAKSYSLQILSRWGNVVFETTDLNKAWDGRINGELAREGTYIYVVKIIAPDDSFFEKSGNITVFY